MASGPQLSRHTRAKTQPGRLDAVDAFLLAGFPDLLTRTDGPYAEAVVLDVGLGATPHTTVALAHAVHTVAPGRPVIGIDVVDRRVAHAERTQPVDGLTYLHHSVADALPHGQKAAVVRAMNLLRQYKPEEVGPMHAQMGAHLCEGGVVIEGSSDGPGHIHCAHVLRATQAGLNREGLWWHTDGTLGFAPAMFRHRLPRDLRRAHLSEVDAFFDRWTACWETARGSLEPPEAWQATCRAMASQDPTVDEVLAHAGHLLWRPVGGVPGPEPHAPHTA